MKLRNALLTASAAAGVFLFVYLANKGPEEHEGHGTGPHTVSLEVQIKNVAVLPAGDRAQLILTAVFDQNGQTPVRLEPPLVSLLGAGGKPAARYLGPMLPEPILTGEGPAEVTLHYWLSQPELNAPLQLEAAGRRYPLDLPRH